MKHASLVQILMAQVCEDVKRFRLYREKMVICNHLIRPWFATSICSLFSTITHTNTLKQLPWLHDSLFGTWNLPWVWLDAICGQCCGLRYVFGVIKRSISQPQLPTLLGFVLNCHKHHIHTSLYLSPFFMTHKMFWVLIRFAIFFGLP